MGVGSSGAGWVPCAGGRLPFRFSETSERGSTTTVAQRRALARPRILDRIPAVTRTVPGYERGPSLHASCHSTRSRSTRRFDLLLHIHVWHQADALQGRRHFPHRRMRAFRAHSTRIAVAAWPSHLLSTSARSTETVPCSNWFLCRLSCDEDRWSIGSLQSRGACSRSHSIGMGEAAASSCADVFYALCFGMHCTVVKSGYAPGKHPSGA